VFFLARMFAAKTRCSLAFISYTLREPVR